MDEEVGDGGELIHALCGERIALRIGVVSEVAVRPLVAARLANHSVEEQWREA
jgi:hypothetical protein